MHLCFRSRQSRRGRRLSQFFECFLGEQDVGRRKGQDWGRKRNITVFVYNKGKHAVQKRALNPKARC